MEIRKQTGAGASAKDRRENWEAIAREALGATSKIQLVDRLLYWISDDGLLTALEECGLLKGVVCKPVTVQQMTKDALAIMLESLNERFEKLR